MKRERTHNPYIKFKGAIRGIGVTYLDIAELLGKSETAISHKVNGYSDFYIGEVAKIQNKYNLDMSVFLT